MHWNYRILRYPKVEGNAFSGGYGLHEVYYDDNGEPTP